MIEYSEPQPVAWRVFDGLSGLSPMKEALYPASRKAHAHEFAKITRGQCQPLYATPSSAGMVSVEAVRLPTQAEAIAAAGVLLRCNGADLDEWTEGEWGDEAAAALRALSGGNQ